MSRLRAVAVFSLLLVLKAVPAAETPHRAVNGQQLTSDSRPSIAVDVSPAFKYVGRVPFALRDIAAGERYVFADLDGKRVVAKGYSVGDDLLMSRFVTLGNEDRRSELILFYLENARDHGMPIADLEKDDAKWTAMKGALDQRSREAFKVVR